MAAAGESATEASARSADEDTRVEPGFFFYRRIQGLQAKALSFVGIIRVPVSFPVFPDDPARTPFRCRHRIKHRKRALGQRGLRVGANLQSRNLDGNQIAWKYRR